MQGIKNVFKECVSDHVSCGKPLNDLQVKTEIGFGIFSLGYLFFPSQPDFVKSYPKYG